ncbi:MAG: hypothetical protein NTV09_13500 [Bacteroidetes bacterium]|nr:hypothetical protein [Bacteroidota bacterium]
MVRAISFVAILFFSVTAYAQSSNMNKASISNSENNVVEIIAPAIPFDRLHQVEIDPANYHKVVNIGDGDSTIDQGQEVNITTSAVKSNNSIISSKKTEVQNPVLRGSSPGKQKMVEVSLPATRQN